jgi:mannan endo-1,4-beta-mannosidase
MLSGQFETTPEPDGTNSPEREIERIIQLTGKTPAIRVFDLRPASPVQYPGGKVPSLAVTRRALDWGRSNGIVAFQWHWLTTNRSGGWDVSVKDFEHDGVKWQGFDLDRALVRGTPEREELDAGIDAVAVELTRLRDAGIPVLWRPLHEAGGGWYWWSARGAESYRLLWQYQFNRLTQKHRLSNLIWVFNPANTNCLTDWYPGREYVDVIAFSGFAATGDHPTFKAEYEVLRQFCGGNKVIALSECGVTPDPEGIVTDHADWAYFCQAPGGFVMEDKINPPDAIKRLFQHPRILNRDAVAIPGF